MSRPTEIEVEGRAYPINTGYEYALAAFACIDDPDITDLERAYGVLGLIYKQQPKNEKAALVMAQKYLRLGKPPSAQDDPDDRDMDFQKDMPFIRASFMSDYGIDLERTPGMHWWEFSELLQGLTDSCVLNRVRDLRRIDVSKIKDPQQRVRIKRAQDRVALTEELSEEDRAKLDRFFDQLT